MAIYSYSQQNSWIEAQDSFFSFYPEERSPLSSSEWEQINNASKESGLEGAYSFREGNFYVLSQRKYLDNYTECYTLKLFCQCDKDDKSKVVFAGIYVEVNILYYLDNGKVASIKELWIFPVNATLADVEAQVIEFFQEHSKECPSDFDKTLFFGGIKLSVEDSQNCQNLFENYLKVSRN